MLKIKNISKSFDGTKILNNVSLDIDNSKIIAITGKSGTGKSTLLRIIQGIEQQDEGDILLEGKSTMVLQSHQLFSNMNVYENISYVPINIHKESKDKVLEKANDLLEKFGLKDHAAKYPKALSGGQQQRVAIIRALMTKADLILLDEPTASLDNASANTVGDALKLLKDMGKTIILTSHDLGFNSKFADECIDLSRFKQNH